MLQIVQRNTTRLLTLINEILDIARLEAGREVLQLSQVNVVDLISETLEAQRIIAQTKNVALHFTIGEDAPRHVISDAPKLSNIINNLTTNAVKFTPSGAVHVTLDKLNENRWQLTIKDSGIGIPADQLTKIFERFYQVDGRETRQYKGSGLGLAIVKETIGFLHGEISVQSQPKQGTVFIVTLPYQYTGANIDA